MSIEDDLQHRMDFWVEKGFNYPQFQRNNDVATLIDRYSFNSKEELEQGHIETAIAGRILRKRQMGGVYFIDLLDGGHSIQLFLNKKTTENFEDLLLLDVGDIVGVTGTLMKTQKGEFSVRTTKMVLLSKNLQPLPLQWDGLKDTETKYRKRYVDLVVNADSRERFAQRSKIVRETRRFLDNRQFDEAETPMMQVLHGGAAARPFETHHNALDTNLYLRVAPELYLKRLVVGGMHRVYELNRNFRNEGVSTRHNPEFTMLEVYEAYTTYIEMMELCEGIIQHVAMQTHGTLNVPWMGQTIDLSEFKRTRMDDLVANTLMLKRETLHDPQMINELCLQNGLELPTNWGTGLLALFETLVEPHLIQPTFVTHYPVEVSPLARISDKEPRFTERFELFVAGTEMANGFSELNDPMDQERRMKEQAQQHQSGNAEAMLFDADYIEALKVGLPPCGGLGIGIDRMTMMLTNTASIRDVLLFPLMRPQQKSGMSP